MRARLLSSALVALIVAAACAPADTQPEPATNAAPSAALPFDAGPLDGGITVTTALERTTAQVAVLHVDLEPRPGFRLAKSPPNEVHLRLGPGITTPANPALVGDAAATDDAEVVYYEKGADVDVAFHVDAQHASRLLEIEGTIVYRACDDVVKVCTRRELAFTERAPAS